MAAFLETPMTVHTLATDRAPSPIVSQRSQDPFESIGAHLRFDAGEEIYAQEDDADLLYRVLTGSVRGTRLLEDGRRQVGGFYFPGDFFGLEIGGQHRSSAEALDVTQVLVIRRSALKYHGEDGAQVERMSWLATGLALQRAQDHMMLLARRSALERVSGFLFEIAAPAHGAWTRLSMSRQDIADYLGLTIETVSRMVSQLQAEGLMVFDGARRFRILQHTRRACLAAA
ncbi:helix-turn-helix domain-containing protein [soil metagenome]